MKPAPPPPARRAPIRKDVLGREHWLDAAEDAIAQRGVEAVSIEALARGLGVTKGSFYWHFATREALVAGVLERWERRATDAVIAAASRLPSAEAGLRLVLESALQASAVGGLESALLSVTDEPLVQEAVERVSKRRLSFVASLYVAAGLPDAEAHRYSLLAYSTYVGLVHLGRAAPTALRSMGGRKAYIEHVVTVLAAPFTAAPKRRR